MICSISGTTPEDPVVSTKSGNVFERRLIEKYIETNNKDPSSGEPLTKEDLVAIKVNKTIKPRPATATSIPSMLQLFQNEWDALMLETFTLKQHLDTVRQELAHALYQHDAACRVIARLIKERDGARNALASLQGQVPVQQGAPSGGAEAMDVDGGAGFTKAIEDRLKEKSDELLKTRKKRAVPAGLADEESIKSFKVSSTNSGIHKASPAGITSVDIHPTKQELIATGGVDSHAHIFNHQTNKIVASLSGHSKRVNQVSFHPTADVVFTASQDRTARIWKAGGDGYSCAHVVKVHSDDVVGVSLQATGDYIATASADRTWALTDIHSGACITKITDDRDAGYSSVSFHPDGLLLGAGTKDNVVRIWDIRARQAVATFEGHTSSVNGLAFSENGYHLATASSDAVKLWDLRKLRNFQTINLKDVSSVSYDHTGTYLLVSHDNSFSVYGFNKQFNPVHTFSEHKDRVTDAKFGKDATWIASVSMDRSLKIHNQ